MIYLPFPFKSCTKCGEYFPATHDYFRKGKKITSLFAWCKPCERSAKRAAYALNPEPHLSRTIKWREQNPDKSLASSMNWLNRHPGYKSPCETNDPLYMAKRQRAYRAKYPERVKQHDREYHDRYPWKRAEQNKNWRKNNPDKDKARGQNRIARINLLPCNFTEEQWRYCLDWWDYRCAYCGLTPRNGQRLVKDHFIPVALDGGYVADNIVPACNGKNGCNNKKWKHEPQRWIIALFGKPASNDILRRIEEYFDHVRLKYP